MCLRVPTHKVDLFEIKLIVKKTEDEFFFQTEILTREAFWNLYKPGRDEHLVLHNIRKGEGYIEDLDFVAVYENQIIGNIISTKAKVIDPLNNGFEVLCVGPISISPDFQHKGVGIKLINHSILSARKMGYKGIILFGNPAYYHRFGFRNAKVYEITTKDLQNFEPFMALELQEKSLDKIKDRFYEDNAFTFN